MAGVSTRLKKLRNELAMLGDEAMSIEEFDGFIGGLLVCPEMIMPSEWLPLVWASENDAPVFGDLDHVNRVLAPLMEHYNHVARTLADKPERYAPLFPVERRTGEVLWEIWIEGFEKAMALRPGAWRSLLTADERTARAYSGIRTLIDVARRDARFAEIEIDALSASGHEPIAEWVVALNAWRVRNRPTHVPTPKPSPVPAIRVPKVGRNEPCPCGSNRKYKRCHGAN